MDKVKVQGLNAISGGVVLAWATEALERGLITNWVQFRHRRLSLWQSRVT
jgi:aldehyde:ferredoxin oxidoreductase